jgi:hypothetical protein
MVLEGQQWQGGHPLPAKSPSGSTGATRALRAAAPRALCAY